MPYDKDYGVSADASSANILDLLQDQPLHPMAVNTDAASGKHQVFFHPAGLGYPAAASPSRTKAGVADDTAPIAGTSGTVLIQYTQARIFLVFETAAGAAVTDGQADVSIWHRGRPGVEDAAAASPGPWIRSETKAEVLHNEEVLDTFNYHREIYIQLTNLAGTALDHVDIYIAGVEDILPNHPFRFSSSGALLVEIKDVHVEVGNLEVQIEASPDQVGEKADSVLIASTLDHTNVVAGNYQPPVAPLWIDGEGRVGVIGSDPDQGPTGTSGPIKVGGRDYLGDIAELTMDPAGADNAIHYVATGPGTWGNAITVEYADGGGGSALTIGVTGTAILVTCDIGAGVTANAVIAAIRADYQASALVSCENAAGNDGTGNIAVMAAAPLLGGTAGDHVYSLSVNDEGAGLGGGLVATEPVTAATDGERKALTLTDDKALRTSDVRQLLSVVGSPGIYASPFNFVATYSSATTIALTGLPTVPTSVQFLCVVERLVATGRSRVLSIKDFDFTFTATGPGTGTLDTNTAAYTAGSSFLVFYVDNQKAYDQVANAIQVVMTNAIQYDWVDVQTPITAGNFAVTNPQDTGWMLGKGEKWLAIEVDWTSLGADTVTLTWFVNNTDTGTTEFQRIRGDDAYPNGAIGGVVALDANGFTLAQAGAGTIYRCYYMKIPATNRFKWKFNSANATGTITVRITEQG